MIAHPVRLVPGDDLRRALEQAVRAASCQAGDEAGHEAGHEAAFVVSGIGSLGITRIRYAGAVDVTTMDGDVEILTLAGSIAIDGSHLHISVSDAQGRVVGGHAAYGCIVRTTAEVLLALIPEARFTREPDARTGYDELVVRPTGRGTTDPSPR